MADITMVVGVNIFFLFHSLNKTKIYIFFFWFSNTRWRLLRIKFWKIIYNKMWITMAGSIYNSILLYNMLHSITSIYYRWCQWETKNLKINIFFFLCLFVYSFTRIYYDFICFFFCLFRCHFFIIFNHSSSLLLLLLWSSSSSSSSLLLLSSSFINAYRSCLFIHLSLHPLPHFPEYKNLSVFLFLSSSNILSSSIFLPTFFTFSKCYLSPSILFYLPPSNSSLLFYQFKPKFSFFPIPLCNQEKKSAPNHLFQKIIKSNFFLHPKPSTSFYAFPLTNSIPRFN